MVAFQKAQIEVTAFFDGTLRENKRSAPQWMETRDRTLAVLKHIRKIGTPPPKVWWMPPSGLRTVLRTAMRTLNIPIVQTVTDHTMEIIAYYHEQQLDGVLGLSADYLIGNVSRFFSSHDLRLSYKGTLESKEFLTAKFLTNFSLTPDHLPYLATLFGGYTVMTEATLRKIYKKLGVAYGDESEARIKRIAEIVRNSPTNDLTEFIYKLELQDWQWELRESVEYYQRRGKFASGKIQLRKRVQIQTAFGKDGESGDVAKNKLGPAAVTPSTSRVAEVALELASETIDNDEIGRKILQDVNKLVDGGDMESLELEEQLAGERVSADPQKSSKSVRGPKSNSNFVYTLPSEILKTALLRHQRGMMDPRIVHLLNKKEIFLPQVRGRHTSSMTVTSNYNLSLAGPRRRTVPGNTVSALILSSCAPTDLRDSLQSVPPAIHVLKDGQGPAKGRRVQGGDVGQTRNPDYGMDLVAAERVHAGRVCGCRTAALVSVHHSASVVRNGRGG